MKIIIAIPSAFLLACMANKEPEPLDKIPTVDFDTTKFNDAAHVVYLGRNQFYTY